MTDDLLPPPTETPVEAELGVLNARTPVATIIAIGLLVIAGLVLLGGLAVAAFATDLPIEARASMGGGIVAGGTGALAAAATLLTRIHD